MINGGSHIRETTYWTGELLPAGKMGNIPVRPAQVALMGSCSVSLWINGFADYLKRLAAVAEAEGLTLGADISPRAISCHLGLEDRAFLSAQWGDAAIYDWYVGDTGVIAGEGPDQDGLYVMEDAHYLSVSILTAPAGGRGRTRRYGRQRALPRTIFIRSSASTPMMLVGGAPATPPSVCPSTGSTVFSGAATIWSSSRGSIFSPSLRADFGKRTGLFWASFFAARGATRRAARG